VGRWASADPKYISESFIGGRDLAAKNRELANFQRTQLWSAFANNPINVIDPDGRFVLAVVAVGLIGYEILGNPFNQKYESDKIEPLVFPLDLGVGAGFKAGERATSVAISRFEAKTASSMIEGSASQKIAGATLAENAVTGRSVSIQHFLTDANKTSHVFNPKHELGRFGSPEQVVQKIEQALIRAESDGEIIGRGSQDVFEVRIKIDVADYNVTGAIVNDTLVPGNVYPASTKVDSAFG